LKYEELLMGFSKFKERMDSKAAPFRMGMLRAYAFFTGDPEARRRLQTTSVLEAYVNDLSAIGEAFDRNEISGLADLHNRWKGISCQSGSGKSDLVNTLNSELGSAIDNLVTQSYQSSLSQADRGNLLNGLFGCLCSNSWNFDRTEITTLWSTGKSVVEDTIAGRTVTDSQTQGLIVAIKGAIPKFFDGSSLCSGDCQTFDAALITFLLTVVEKVGAISAPSGGWPDLATSSVACQCNGISWSTIMDPLFPVGNELSLVQKVDNILSGSGASVNSDINSVIGAVAAQIDFVFSSSFLCGTSCAAAMDHGVELFVYLPTRALWPYQTAMLAYDVLGGSLGSVAQESDMPTPAEIASFADTLRGEACRMDFAGLARGFETYVLNGFDTANANSVIDFSHDIAKKLVVFECDAGGQIAPAAWNLTSGMAHRAMTASYDGDVFISPNVFSRAEIDGLVSALFGCSCHYFTYDTRMIPFIKDRITHYQSLPNLGAGLGDAIVDTARQAIRVSNFCGSADCKGTFDKLFAIIDKLSKYPAASAVGACTAASGASCFGEKQTFSESSYLLGSATCRSTPVRGAGGLLPYPMGPSTQVNDYSAQLIYWSTCWMSTDCPPDDVSMFEVTQDFTIAETTESFTPQKQNAFKQGFINMLGVPGSGITVDDVELRISAGSIVVTAILRTASVSVKNQATTTMQNISPSAASNALGVSVSAITPPTTQQITYSPPPAPPSASDKKDDDNNIIIIAVAAGGGVALLIVVLIACLCYYKGKSDQAVKA